MTRDEADFIGGMNMCDEISNEAYKKIMCHCEEQEPCEDCISRQDAIDALGEKPLAWTESEYELGLQNQWQSDVNALKALPSVQPERKNGKWELVHDFDDISDAMKPLGRVVCCSECGYPENRLATNFCPNCGAKMEVE